jgi:hypothetical protein
MMDVGSANEKIKLKKTDVILETSGGTRGDGDRECVSNVIKSLNQELKFSTDPRFNRKEN